MSQMSFGDAEYAGKKKRTRREVFLAEMDQVIRKTGCSGSFAAFLHMLRTDPRFYPKTGDQRPTPSPHSRCRTTSSCSSNGPKRAARSSTRSRWPTT